MQTTQLILPLLTCRTYLRGYNGFTEITYFLERLRHHYLPTFISYYKNVKFGQLLQITTFKNVINLWNKDCSLLILCCISNATIFSLKLIIRKFKVQINKSTSISEYLIFFGISFSFTFFHKSRFYLNNLAKSRHITFFLIIPLHP